MNATKFDMTAAWNEAVRLVSANRDVLLVVAGVFFFLPYGLFTLLFSDRMQALQAAQGGKPDPDAMGEAMIAFYGDIWWVLLLIAVMQGIGMLGLLTLLTDRSRPTVGQALAAGARLLLPYIGAQLVMSALMGLIALVPLVVAAAGSVVAGVLVGIVALVAVIYLFTKFLLVPAVIAIERVTNPIAALGRSWRLTRGNSLRIFAFVLLLGVSLVVVSSVISMIAGLVLALAGTHVALIGQAIVSGLVNAAFVTLFLAVLAAIHRQLAGPSPERVGATFE